MSYVLSFCLGVVALFTIASGADEGGTELDNRLKASAPSAAESKIEAEAAPNYDHLPETLPVAEDEAMNFRPYSPWGFSYFNWSTQNMAQTREGIARFGSYNYFGVDYRVSYLSKVSIRQTFFMNGAGPYSFCRKIEETGPCVQREAETSMGDLYVQYYRNRMALLPGNIGMRGWVRAYLPLSEVSRSNHQVTELATKLTFTKPISNRVELNYNFEPHYSILTKRGRVNEFGTKVNANKYGQIRHFFEVAERITPEFGLAQQLGFNHEWFYAVPDQNIPEESKDFVELKLSALFSIAGVRLTAGFNNKILVDENDPIDKRPFRIFREDETEYSLMTTVYF